MLAKLPPFSLFQVQTLGGVYSEDEDLVIGDSVHLVVGGYARVLAHSAPCHYWNRPITDCAPLAAELSRRRKLWRSSR